MPGVSNIIDICKDEYRKGYKDGYKDSDSRIPDLIRDIHDCVAEEMYEKGKADAIDEAIEKLNNTRTEITFDLPVEEILGDDIDLDDFAMLVQDAVQVYRKMVLGVLEQLKSKKM